MNSISSNKKLLARQDGFGLVEVIVAAGIFGFIALGMATMMAHFSSSAENVNAQMDRFALVSMLQTTMINENRCSKAVGKNQKFDPKISWQKQGEKGLPLVFDLGDGIVLGQDTDVPNFKVKVAKLNLDDIQAVSTDEDGNQVYTGTVWAQFATQSRLSNSAERLMRMRPIGDIAVTVKDGVIVSCSAPQPVAAEKPKGNSNDDDGDDDDRKSRRSDDGDDDDRKSRRSDDGDDDDRKSRRSDDGDDDDRKSRRSDDDDDDRKSRRSDDGKR